MLAGEILYRQGRTDEAITRLREAVFNEDALQYCEPPEWILPPRPCLWGGRSSTRAAMPEAEAVYRQDLATSPPFRPENGWSLFGLSRGLKDAKEDGRGRRRRRAPLKKAWQHADIKLTGSCLCLPAKN